MVNLFTIEEPYYTVLLIPIIVSTLTTSKLFTISLNITLLILFSFFTFQYLETYIVLFFIFCFLTKNFFKKIFKRKILLTDLQREIYNRDFYLLTEEQFILFFEKANLITTKLPKQITAIGTNFNKVYYFAKIPRHNMVHLKFNEHILSYI